LLNIQWALGREQTDECCVLIEDYDDDVMFDVSFERMRTPITTVRSSTTASTDSPSCKLKVIRVEKGAKINEEVDVYL